jgi:thiol-disulfide isomerase/thioredoxin
VVGLYVLVAVLVAATVLGLLLRARAGRVRVAAKDTSPNGWELAETPAGDARFLLLQLSSPICAPCRQTATLLTDVVAADPGLRHVEIDVAERPEVARALSVLRTPTTVGFDRAGREVLRISGVPRRDELAAALAPTL